MFFYLGRHGHPNHHSHSHGRHGSPRGRGGWGGGFPGGFDMAFAMGERGQGGRGRRMFGGDELRLILLKLIEEAPRHGYDLIREIEARSNGAYAPSPGVVYPTLTMLDDMDLIAEHKSEGAKKQFAITEAGTAHLAENAAEVAALFGRLAELGERHARTSGGPVRRAMHNLKTVLAASVFDEEVDPERLHEIAEILDEAARKIERL